jgi:hypothetical protein
MSINEDEVIDDGLTDEQRAADAKMVAADFDPPYATLAAKKRKGNRRRPDKRFKTSDDSVLVAPSTTTNHDEPWDSAPADALDETVRISRIVFPYLVPGAAVDTFRDGINKGELILKIFDGRSHTTANLMKLYAFTRRRYKNGGRPLHGPIVELIESILIKEGAIEQPSPEPISATFGNIFENIPSVVGEAKI